MAARPGHRRPLPEGDWGYFKVPGFWPGLQAWEQEDCQTCFAHPAWKGKKLGEITAAWYQREITIPSEWTGRRIALTARMRQFRWPSFTWTAGRSARYGSRPEKRTSPAVPPRRDVHGQPARHRHAAEGGHDVARRHRRGQKNQGQGGAAGPVRRPLLPRHSRRPADRGRKVDTSVRNWEITLDMCWTAWRRTDDTRCMPKSPPTA